MYTFSLKDPETGSFYEYTILKKEMNLFSLYRNDKFIGKLLMKNNQYTNDIRSKFRYCEYMLLDEEAADRAKILIRNGKV